MRAIENRGPMDEGDISQGEEDYYFPTHAQMDEWYSPDVTPGIAFPFYLAHPRLMRLERKMLLEIKRLAERPLTPEAG